MRASNEGVVLLPGFITTVMRDNPLTAKWPHKESISKIELYNSVKVITISFPVVHYFCLNPGLDSVGNGMDKILQYSLRCKEVWQWQGMATKITTEKLVFFTHIVVFPFMLHCSHR